MTKARSEVADGQELAAAVLRDKANGISDQVIGKKHGVNLKYIERLVTQAHGINVSAIKQNKKIKSFAPRDFAEQQTTVWSFKQRGTWATHSGEYRGNWSPYIPRNVILKYSEPGATVLDYFCGAGTTAVEAKLLGRKCIGVDINDKAIELARRNIDFENAHMLQLKLSTDEVTYTVIEPELRVGDARDLSFLDDETVDLICAHPPYADIINYTESAKGDLSFYERAAFLEEMAKVANESFRVLRPGRQCAILIGDMRKKRHVIPLGFELINVYLKAGFHLKELIIKRQHNCKTTGFWYSNSIKYNFLLLAHEYLPIFEKPKSRPRATSLKNTRSGAPIRRILAMPAPEAGNGKLESTSVWVFPKEDFDRTIQFNVCARYGGQPSEMDSVLHPPNDAIEGKLPHQAVDPTKLIFLEAHLGECGKDIASLINDVRGNIERAISALDEGGYLVLRLKDARIDGYLEPVAKRVLDAIQSEQLWLKEIVVATSNGTPENSRRDSSEFLEIAHEYLLVYEKVGLGEKPK